MFSKILVPLDGSEHSFKALDVAVKIAKKFDGNVTLIHVYSVGAISIVFPEQASFATKIPVITSAEYSRMAWVIREAGARILAGGEEKVRAEGVKVEKLLKEGHVVHEIVKAACEGGFNLIVMGAKGVSRIKEIILGSISDGVIRNAPCPVLIVK